MTNYRFEICDHHDQPQFNYCFDCGSPLVKVSMPDGDVLTCKQMPIHIQLWLKPHVGDLENDECEIKAI